MIRVCVLVLLLRTQLWEALYKELHKTGHHTVSDFIATSHLKLELEGGVPGTHVGTQELRVPFAKWLQSKGNKSFIQLSTGISAAVDASPQPVGRATKRKKLSAPRHVSTDLRLATQLCKLSLSCVAAIVASLTGFG